MGELTSIDYANYIRYDAFSRHSVVLNKTQVNKMLFICYGVYLAATDGKKMFTDDSPKAWPYGPVFPRVYKHFGEYKGVAQSVIEKIEKDDTAYKIIGYVVDKFFNWTAYQLSEWSHRSDGSWFKTVYGADGQQSPQWNKVIEDSLIQDYFTPKS